MTWLSHMLDVQLFGLDAGAHHLTSVALHALAALLLFAALRRMTGALWRSALVAALFALHPLQVEAVAWVAGRKDVLAGALWMLALWAHARAVERGRRRDHALVLGIFVLGLMAKASVITLPAVLLLLDFWPLGRFAAAADRGGPRRLSRWRGPLIEKIPYALLGAVALLFYMVANRMGDVSRLGDAIPSAGVLARGCANYWLYLGRVLWPVNLATPYPQPGPVPLWVGALAALALLAVTAVALRLVRRAPHLTTGWLWFVIVLAPMAGLSEVGTRLHADRYTYLPLVGLGLAAAWSLGELPRRWRHGRVMVAAASAAALLLLGVLSWHQTRLWQDDETRLKHAIAVTDSNIDALQLLGDALAHGGRLREAEAIYLQALAIEPGLERAENNLANVYVLLGDDARAVGHYRHLLERHPWFTDAHYNLASALLRLGQVGDAVASLEQLLQAHPDHEPARALLFAIRQELARQPHAQSAPAP